MAAFLLQLGLPAAEVKAITATHEAALLRATLAAGLGPLVGRDLVRRSFVFDRRCLDRW